MQDSSIEGGHRAVGGDEALAERREEELAHRARGGGETHRPGAPVGAHEAREAAMTIVNEPPATPRPTSTPPVSVRTPGEVLWAMSATPAA